MGTLGAAQTRQGTSGSLDSPFAAALFGAWRRGESQAQAATIAARSRRAEAMLVRERCAMGTLGAAQTRQGTSGSLDSPFAAALLERGAAENRRLKRRPSPRGAVRPKQCWFVSDAPWARWALPRPAKEPQVPWILHLLPRFWSVALRKIAGSSGDHRRAEPSVRTSLDQKRTAGAERPPRPRGLRRFCAVAVARRLSRPAWAPSMTARQRLLADAGRPTRRPLPMA